MSNPAQYSISKPIFQGAKNAIVDCQVEECDWTYCAPRDILQHAWNEHYRMNHSQEVGVTYIHKNLRESLWFPTTH